MKEQWLPIIGYEGQYSISSKGRVRSESRTIERSDGRTQTRHSRLLKSVPDPKGYLRVNLFQNNIGATRYVHRMMLEAFVGPPKGLHIRHLNGNQTDNRLENLRYGTPSENQFDRVRHGRHYNAEKTHCKYGHPFDETNTYTQHNPDGSIKGRWCRACGRIAQRKHRA